MTLTGPGGSGKTRLALQAAAELSEEFLDGTWFVALASLRENLAVRSAVAEAVGLQADDDVAAWLASRRVLLVLDNLEHLQGVPEIVAELSWAGRRARHPRAPLQLAVERELPVDPLAARLRPSCSHRAEAVGRIIDVDETVTAVCRRLDNLPLAIELAAARAKVSLPSPCSGALTGAPVARGGAIDRRAAADAARDDRMELRPPWSGRSSGVPPAIGLPRRFTMDAAEAISGADLDQLAALLDKSLLKALGDERVHARDVARVRA